METTIRELLNLIVRFTKEEHLQPYVLNDMLQNYTVNSKKPLEISGWYTIIRKDNKNVDFENVELQYRGPLIFTYCNHSGEWFIRELNDFKQVEDYILGPAGCFNMFTGIVLVVYDGNIRKYNVAKILPNGDKVILNPTEDEEATSAVVEWI